MGNYDDPSAVPIDVDERLYDDHGQTYLYAGHSIDGRPAYAKITPWYSAEAIERERSTPRDILTVEQWRESRHVILRGPGGELPRLGLAPGKIIGGLQRQIGVLREAVADQGRNVDEESRKLVKFRNQVRDEMINMYREQDIDLDTINAYLRGMDLEEYTPRFRVRVMLEVDVTAGDEDEARELTSRAFEAARDAEGDPEVFSFDPGYAHDLAE